MASSNQVELVVTVEVDKANQSIKSVNANLSSIESTAARSARGAAAGIDGMTAAMVKGAAAGNILAHAFEQVVGWLKEYGTEIVKYAARTQTMGVVTNQLAKVNEYNSGAVGRLVERIKQLGISTQEAHGVVQRMIFAELDLSKATELARVAQDAAVIAGVNSSEALENIILGITTGQTRLLHTMGLQVSLEQTIQEEEKKRHHTLSESEKREAMLNKVLQEGVKIRGTYESAMGTAGKQMTSLTRLWQEAKNALGEQFLPEFSKFIKMLGEMLDWVRKNASEISGFIKLFGAAALGAAVGQFISWMAAARISVLALNAAMALNPWIAGGMLIAAAGYVGYEQYQDYKQRQQAQEQEMKDAGIRAAIQRGQTLEDLKKAGYSEQEIKGAFFGRRKLMAIPGFETEMPSDWKSPEGIATIERDEKGFKLVFGKKQQTEAERRAEQEAREWAEEARKHQVSVERQFRDEAIANRLGVITVGGKHMEVPLTGYAKEVADMNAKLDKATHVNKEGVERFVPLTKKAWESVMETMRAQWAEFQQKLHKDTKEYFADYVREMEDADHRRHELEIKQFQERLAYDVKIAETNMQHLATVYAFEEQRAGFDRDARLRTLDAFDAQTIEQKAWVEQQKAQIEIDYLERVHEVKQRLFDLETSQRVMDYELEMKRLGYSADEIQRRIAEYTQQRDQIRQQNQEVTGAAVDAARQNAANRTAAMIRDHNRQIFDSFKRQAEGVFDALVTKSQSVWSAIGNAFKTAMLTAIKEVVTSRVAATLMYLFTGQRVTFAGGGAGPGGSGGILGGLGGILGVGAIPVFGGTGGGPIHGGSVGGWGTPPFIPAGASGAGGATRGGLLNWGGMVGGWKDALTRLGNIGFRPERWRMDELGNMTKIANARGIGGWQGGALLAGGGLLALEGLRRGGWSGVGMTTAGGAMIGAKFGGPIGAAIGAIAGFAAGIVRLFVKGAEDKAKEKIKALYGVDIHDKALLKQIVDTAKSAFGGNLDMAIRSPQIRDLIQLYAMTTGQTPIGMPQSVTPLSLAQTGGALYQTTQYQNGTALSGLAGLPSLDQVGGGVATNAGGTIVIPLSIDSQTVGNVVIQNGRVVTQGAITAMKSNVGRREMTALQLAPGTLVS
ncbi:MAG: hypothetical protein IT167_00995 [Bryobacterales bacterium]|nr:hypothetical protein [Bryobacterales bacterium]